MRGLDILDSSTSSKVKLLSCLDNGQVDVVTFANNPSSTKAATETNILQLGKHVSRMRLAPSESSAFGLGGKDHDLSVWDLSTKQPIWRAKNV